MARLTGDGFDVAFNILNEDRQLDNDVTSHSIEGGNIADHKERQPDVYSLSCVYFGSRPGDVHGALRRARNARDVVRYRGRANMSRCVVTSLSTSVDQGAANGFYFNMTIQEVRTARPSTSGLSGILRAEVEDVGSAGRVQTV